MGNSSYRILANTKKSVSFWLFVKCKLTRKDLRQTRVNLCRMWSRRGTCCSNCRGECYDMGQNDTIGKIELKPSIVLSSDNTNCKNDIQLFHQLFDELSVYRDYH